MRRRWLMELYLDALPKVLPASSYYEIAVRMEKRTDLKISLGIVSMILSYVRKNATALGWTVHYAKRGPNPWDVDRFIAVPVVHTGVMLSSEEQTACRNGLVTTLSVLMVMQERQKVMLEAVRAHIASRREKRVLEGIETDLVHGASKLSNALDELRDSGTE